MNSCFTCTLCCTLTRVPELDKPEWLRCNHCSVTGCTIYEDRPQSCKNFKCAWLSGVIPEGLRPDICGVMMEDYKKFLFVMSERDAWRDIIEYLNWYAKKIPVVISSNSTKALLLPPGVTPEEVMVDIREALSGCNY